MSIERAQLLAQATRRRTIAVISHPDAGKSTLTEALLLHANAISEAGAVHGKAGRRGTVSDWMDMERARGISVSSAAIQFTFEDTVINLVDTPGHADFSEDTFRVLAAVDAAIMLIDAAKGVEAQTMKLLDVCRSRGVPIITMVNKWDRPGRDALALIDEIRFRTGLPAMPRMWPVGEAGVLRGLFDVTSRGMLRYQRTAGGARVAASEVLGSDAAAEYGAEWATAVEEAELLKAAGHAYDREAFVEQRATPTFFGAAVQNIGVRELLEFVARDAPAPSARGTVGGGERAIDAPFSAHVFKVQSGMDPAHRDRVAFMRVVSGVFERGMVVHHAKTGRPFATKYAQQMFGRERESVDLAWPGDIVGLVNASALRPGDTLYAGDAVEFPGLPHFAPEHFRVATSADSSKHKQFRKGITQLDEEGVVQVLMSDRRGPASPVLGAVGPMQFEVAQERMRHEYGAPLALKPLDYTVAVSTTQDSASKLGPYPGCEAVTRADGSVLALLTSPWRLRSLRAEAPDLVLEPLRGIAEPSPDLTNTTPRRV